MRSALRRLWYLLRRRRLEAELVEEMAFHRDMAERDAGQRDDTGDPRIAARRAFGSELLARNRSRDVWIRPWLQDFAQDFHFAARLLRKEPAFTAAVVLVLGVGIGVNTMQFTVVEAMCLRGLPIAQPDRVLAITTRDANDRPHPLSYPAFDDLRSTTRAFAGVTAFVQAPTVIADDHAAPERVLGVSASAAVFRLLGVAPALGRDFAPDDDKPGATAVVIISHRLWAARYGSDAGVIGRSVRVDGTPSVLIGVMPGSFRFPSNADLWRPLALLPGLLLQKRDARTLNVFGRMTQQASLTGARAELSAIAERFGRDYPDTDRNIRLAAVPINDAFNQDIRNPAWIAFTAVGILILLIACANAANLLLMRAVVRSQEIGIRAALGASRVRIIRQLLVESALLAALGSGLGLALSTAGLRLFDRAIPANILPFFMTFTIDGRVLSALLAASAGTVLLFGVAPAMHLSRTDPDATLRAGSRTAHGTVRATRWMTVFLTVEFALTMVLLAAVVVSARNALTAQRSEIVVAAEHLLTASVTLPSSKYPTDLQRMAFYGALFDRMRLTAGKDRFALATTVPLGGATRRPMTIETRPPANGERPPAVDVVAVTPGYFRVIGAPLLRGREFNAADGEPGHEAVIVNQRFADVFLAGSNPVGERLRLLGDGPGTAPAVTIVGEAPTIRQRPSGLVAEPVAYVPLRTMSPSTAALIVTTDGNPASAAPLLRANIAALDSDLPIDRVLTLDDAMHELAWNPRLSNALVVTLTGIALGLSILGLYAVTAHGVARRTHEIGIRVALGAPTRTIVAGVLGRAVRHIACGFVVGVFCTVAWGRLFADSAGPTSTRASDPLVLAMIAALLAIVALIASVAPARRAVRIDPAVALRCE